MILARTVKGKGIPLAEGKGGWHGKAFKKGEELDSVLRALDSQLVADEEPAQPPDGPRTRRDQSRSSARRRTPRLADFPTSSATPSPRAKRTEAPLRSWAMATIASSRSTVTSRTPPSAKNSRSGHADRFFRTSSPSR
jgi:transketolase